MRFLIGPAALLAVLAATPSFAADDAGAKRACFRAQDVKGFNVVDPQTVDVSITPRNAYRLTLFTPSPDIDWSHRIGLESHGGSWICSGDDATLIVPDDGGIGRYPVTGVRKLAPEEIKASEKKR